MGRKWMVSAIGVAVLAMAAPWVVPLFSPWSRINSEVQEIDLISGARRSRQYFYWLPVLDVISDTAISSQLGSSPGAAPRWEPVNTFGPYVKHSPHYVYHGAFSDIRNLELMWDDYNFPKTRRLVTASRLLEIWRSSGNRAAAESYLRNLQEASENEASTEL